MQEPPLVTVVIPCRDRPALLHRALASLLAQEERRWRAVVVDDASDAPLAGVVEASGDARLRCLRLETGLGPGGAREAGLACVATPFAAFLDSDDVWSREWLSRMLAHAALNDARVQVCGAWVEGPGRPRPRPARDSRPGERIASYLYVANQFAQASGIFAPAALARAAGFGGLRQYEDHYFLIRAEALGARIEVRAAPLYRQTADAGAGRAGRTDDAGRARAFLAAAGPMMTSRERQAFALRCLGPGLAEREPRAAMRLAATGLRRPALAGAAAKLALRAMAGERAYEAARAQARTAAMRSGTAAHAAREGPDVSARP